MRPFPGWPPPSRKSGSHLVVFYDGDCGLCHRLVQFLLHRMEPDRFRFAPLQGTTAEQTLPLEMRNGTIDSVVVLLPDGTFLTHSDASIRVGRELGGWCRIVAEAGRLLPKAIRDIVYTMVARRRRLLFAKPKERCPLMKPSERVLFLE